VTQPFNENGIRGATAVNTATGVQTKVGFEPKQQITDPALYQRNIPAHAFLFGTAGQEERLYSDYRVRAHPKKFFVLGRVFSVLWSEPAGEEADLVSAAVPINRGIVAGRYGQHVFSKVRRFVVIRPGNAYCSALPIVSYGVRGVAMDGVASSEHAIIYTGTQAPGPTRDELPESGGIGMQNRALRVVPDNKGYKLDVMSRVDFGKVHTVHHNTKVKAIGMIHHSCMEALSSQFLAVWNPSYSAVLNSRPAPNPAAVDEGSAEEDDDDDLGGEVNDLDDAYEPQGITHRAASSEGLVGTALVKAAAAPYRSRRLRDQQRYRVTTNDDTSDEEGIESSSDDGSDGSNYEDDAINDGVVVVERDDRRSSRLADTSSEAADLDNTSPTQGLPAARSALSPRSVTTSLVDIFSDGKSSSPSDAEGSELVKAQDSKETSLGSRQTFGNEAITATAESSSVPSSTIEHRTAKELREATQRTAHRDATPTITSEMAARVNANANADLVEVRQSFRTSLPSREAAETYTMGSSTSALPSLTFGDTASRSFAHSTHELSELHLQIATTDIDSKAENALLLSGEQDEKSPDRVVSLKDDLSVVTGSDASGPLQEYKAQLEREFATAIIEDLHRGRSKGLQGTASLSDTLTELPLLLKLFALRASRRAVSSIEMQACRFIRRRRLCVSRHGGPSPGFSLPIDEDTD
jgi:hypothetical protein